jgi:ZIP family zinc transporter
LAVVLFGLALGYLSIIAIHEHLPHEHLFKKADVEHKKGLSRAFLIVLAITLHNFPEGLAVGVGFGAQDMHNALTLTLAIAIQNVPEGLIVAFGLVSEGVSRRNAFWAALLSGLVEPLSSIVGFGATRIATVSLPISFGFAAGAMLLVTCQEIFPELFREGREKSATFGVVMGIVLMVSLDHLLS